MEEDEAGDERGRVGLAQVYTDNAAKLRRVLARRGRPPRNERFDLGGFEVDDVVQEVFARLLMAPARLSDVRDLAPYLLIMARNLRIDLVRRRTRLLADPSVFLRSQEAAASSSDEFAYRYERLCRLEVITDHVARLPPPLAAVYEARFVRGLSQRDAAAELGVTRRRVRTLERELLVAAARELQNSSV